jgi:hypothetical protein
MFRLLGLLAALDLRLNRIRFNFIPLNLAIAALLLWGVSLGVARLTEGPGDILPRDVAVADLAAGRVPMGTFVRVSGFVEPGLILELGRRGSGGRKLESVRERLRLLHDAGTGAIWVAAGAAAVEPWTRVTFVGMVRPLPQAARTATARDRQAIGSRTPSLDILLEPEARPRSFVSGLAHLVLCAPPLALLAWVWIKRSQIFRPGTRVRVDPASADGPVDMRVSARLQLDARTSRRFVEVPVQLGWTEGGGLSVVANVDASSYVMGVRAVAREGLWTLAIPADATLSVVVGEVAFGLAVRPAARIEARRNGKIAQRMTLTFANACQRDRVLQVLQGVFGARRPAAA